MQKIFPKGDKSTWQSQAEAISSGSIKVKEADIPLLLGWLKDMNWPGAETIANFLSKSTLLSDSSIRKILHSGDDVWIYWVLTTFKDSFSSDLWTPLSDDLESISCKPNEEGSHIAALLVLRRWKLISLKRIRQYLEEAKAVGVCDLEDYKEIEHLLES